MVIKQGMRLPTLAIKCDLCGMPNVVSVQIAADSRAVTVAYLDQFGQALEVREHSVQENPELGEIVKQTYFDDVWDIDMVLSLIDPVSGEQQAPALEALIPAYLESIGAAV